MPVANMLVGGEYNYCYCTDAEDGATGTSLKLAIP